jgi:DNA polymerase-3 subunit gamma/tau
MRIRINETTEKKRAYTATEKFEFFNDLNPLLTKLKEEFDLAID